MLWSTSKESRRMGRRRGAINMDLVFGAALTIVIVGALALTIYYGFFRKSASKIVANAVVKFYCTKCEQTFEVPQSELPMGPHGPLDCRSCSAKRTSLRMLSCPACGEGFVPDRIKFPDRAKKEKLPDICPKCNTDRDAWFKEREPK